MALRMHDVVITLVLVVALGCGRSTPVPPNISTGGNYPPVTSKSLLSKEFSHRTGTKDFDFSWVFNETSFKISGPEIPPELQTLFNESKTTTTEIKGRWRISGEVIEFYEIKSTGIEHPAERVELRIFNTGVIRIQTSDAQYVF